MIHIRITMIMTLCAVVTVCVGCGETQVVRNIDPQAEAFLRNMSKTLDSAEAFSFEAEGIMDGVLDSGQIVQVSRRSKIAYVRPDKLHMTTDGDDVSRAAWFNGETLTLLIRPDNIYSTEEIAGSVENMLDTVMDEYGLTVPVADLLFSNSYEGFIASARTGQYVGLHEADGSKCHHLAFQADTIDWQIWIDAGEIPVPRKLVITYIEEEGRPQYTVRLSKWDLAAKLPPETFEFHPPKGATRVKMAELFGKNEGAQP